MAKRKRLDPLPGPVAGGFAAEAPFLPSQDVRAPEVKALEIKAMGLSFAAPIARVSADAAREAALEELGEALRLARAEGRLIQKLPLERIETEHLVRDRIGLDAAEMAPLVESLRTRGQQTPVEVVALEGGRYGLISGWRRVQALRRLCAETGDAARFGTVLALLRQPRDAAEAYVAMVEENEIRLGLSYYERARIVARAVEAGVFPETQSALRALFASGSRARRSKIGSFLTLVAALDGVLRFPAAIGERLGLQLAQRLETDADFGPMLSARLAEAEAASPEEEAAVLARALQPPPRPAAAATLAEEVAPGIRLSVTGSARAPVLSLSGPQVDAAFRARLLDWLRQT